MLNLKILTMGVNNESQLFEENLRGLLPVNYFKLKKPPIISMGKICLANSTFHNENSFTVGNTYKPISNVI